MSYSDVYEGTILHVQVIKNSEKQVKAFSDRRKKRIAFRTGWGGVS